MDEGGGVALVHQVALAIALTAGATAPLVGQSQNLPDLDLGDSGEQLRNAAQGLAQGCDYMKYLSMADNMYNAFETIKTVEVLRKSFNTLGMKAGVPFTDYIKLVMNSVSTRLNNDAAKSLRKGLILTVEQTCANIIQGDEVRRILELTRDGQIGTQNEIPVIAKLFQKEKQAEVDTTLKAAVDSAIYQNATAVVPFTDSDRNDALLMTMVKNAEQVTKFAKLSLAAIDSVEENLRKIQDEAYLFAEPDQNGVLGCPKGFPPPRMAPELTRKPKPICGPAGGDRSLQLLRATAEEMARLKVIDSRTIPLMATVEAYQGLQASHKRRLDKVVVLKHAGF